MGGRAEEVNFFYFKSKCKIFLYFFFLSFGGGG